MIKLIKKNKTWILILLPCMFIVWKFLLFLDLPYPFSDSPAILSHTFSILNGDYLKASFAFNYWIPYQNPPSYGFITSIFFFFFHRISETYSIFIFEILLISFAIILSNLYMVRKGIKSYKVRLIIFISFLTTSYIYDQRYELLNIVILLIILIIIDNSNSFLTLSKILAISFLTAIAILVHPVGGIFGLALFSFIAFKNKLKLKFYFEYYIFTILLSSIIYAPIILLDPIKWYHYLIFQNFSPAGPDPHLFNYLVSFQYFLFLSPSSFIPYLILFTNNTRFKQALLEFILLFIFMFIIALFNRYYYLSYIYLFIIWRVTKWKSIENLNSFYGYVLYLSLLISPLRTYYLPTISQILNREYSNNFRNILNYIINQNYCINYNKVWCTSKISMPLIKNPNSRFFYNSFTKDMDRSLGYKDIILIDNLTCLHYVKKNFNLVDSTMIIKNVVAPVKVNVEIYTNSTVREKKVPTGLWEITLK